MVGNKAIKTTTVTLETQFTQQKYVTYHILITFFMHTPLILVSGRQRQVNIYEFKSSLSIQRAPGQPATHRERERPYLNLKN